MRNFGDRVRRLERAAGVPCDAPPIDPAVAEAALKAMNAVVVPEDERWGHEPHPLVVAAAENVIAAAGRGGRPTN